MHHSHPKSGFTLVEISITSAIIGLLATLAVPNLLEAGIQARNRRFAADIRAAGHAFVQYAMEHGEYPKDKTPSQMPDGMAEYLSGIDWGGKTVIGGQWDWDYKVFSVLAAVSVKSPAWSAKRMKEIDAIIDNGDLSSGQFRRRSGGYMYVLEEL